MTETIVERRSRRWRLLPTEPEVGKRLAAALRLHPLVGQLLAARGLRTPAEADAFLSRKLALLSDPETVPGLAAAADLIHQTIRGGGRICIYGDYDCDGMCATAIMVRTLRLAGADVRYYIPHRLDEGYGVNAAALQQIHAEGVALVVTVDCGITSVGPAQVARDLGLRYIVTDHHELGPALPNADAIVHPSLDPSLGPAASNICGTAVAFKLAWEVARRISGQRKTRPEFQKLLLDMTALTALATVCDVMPLVGENRVLVHHGLIALRKEPPIGLAALMAAAGIGERDRLTATDLGFKLGPRMNACGRIGQATYGVELLLTDDPIRAQQLAQQLDEDNRNRQTTEQRILREAKELAERHYDLGIGQGDPAIVLGSPNWHQGIVGIVASRMVEAYHRPCLLLAVRQGEATGSGRSIAKFHLQQALAACGEHLITSGGHAMAAGLRLRQADFEPFRDAFLHYASTQLQPDDLCGELKIDAEVPLHVFTVDLVKALTIMEPFGLKNPTPLFLASDLRLVDQPRPIGGGGRHLSFRVKQGDRGTPIKCIAFGLADRLEELTSQSGSCCLAFTPILNHYNGLHVELQVRDFKPGQFV